MKTSYSTLTCKLNNGKIVTAKNVDKETVTLFIDNKGGNHWLTQDAINQMINKPIAQLGTTEKGESFIAKRDSRRTKLQAWVATNPTKDVKDCDIPVDEQQEPLYYEGDTVPRTAGLITLVGFKSIEEFKAEQLLASLTV